MPNIAAEMPASSPSKSGPPSPGGSPSTEQPTTPPTESPRSRAFRTAFSWSFSVPPETSPIAAICAWTAMPRRASHCSASAPAAQSGAVRRPEFLPPPVGIRPVSIHWPKSAWPGRGTVRSAP